MMLKFVILFAFIPALSLAADFNMIECAGIPKPVSLAIDECPNGRPCSLQVGQTINTHVTFHTDKPITILPFSIVFIKQSGQLEFITPKSDNLCTFIDGQCPLEVGDYTASGHFVLPEDLVPEEEIIIASIARDQDFNPVVCYTLKAKLHAKE